MESHAKMNEKMNYNNYNCIINTENGVRNCFKINY